MKNKDYTKYSKPIQQPEVQEEVVDIQPEVPEVEAPKTVIGVVTDCAKLNVRAEPKSNAEVVCVVTAKTDLVIDEAESTEDFYKVYTESGAEGYCMKRFISIMP